MLETSRYNFFVASAGSAALFNARTGALLRLEGEDGVEIAELLCEWPLRVELDSAPAGLLDQLQAGGFLIADGTDEVSSIAERFRRACSTAPVVLTITTTMDCNLGCYYCYEDRTSDALRATDVSAVVELARRRLESSGTDSLHVDWYGGEPMLNVEFIEQCSPALQALCATLGVSYHASIISNGTAWPDEVGDFIRRHKIRQVQISFDGLQHNHDKRRRYRRGRAPAGSSSFAVTWELVSRLLEFVRVDVRFNIDGGNAEDLFPFLDKAEAAGWFSRAYPAVFQPAKLDSYSERSGFMRDVALDVTEFDQLRALVRERARGRFTVEESEAPEGVASPRDSVCAALATHSDVIGADRKLYRCGLQVGEAHRSVATLANETGGGDAAFWRSFDPTTRPQCSRCSFLPVCWGGCPKKHLEGDDDALHQQSLYWRHNLPRLIANTAGLEGVTTAYTEAQQFRDGYRPAVTARRHVLPVLPAHE